MFRTKMDRSAGDAPAQNHHDHHHQRGSCSANATQTQADFYLDEIRARIMRPLTPMQWQDLRAACDDAYMLTLSRDKVHPIANYQDAPLVVVMPKPPALRLLDDLHGIILNYVEFAYDRTVSNPLALQRFFDQHFSDVRLPWIYQGPELPTRAEVSQMDSLKIFRLHMRGHRRPATADIRL